MTHRRTVRLLGVIAAAAAVLSLTATSAQAATTYTPTGGPNITFTGSNVSFHNLDSNQTTTCTTFNTSGVVVDSADSRAYGVDAADLTGLAASCTNPLAGPVTITRIGTWGFTITGDALGSSWPARFTNLTVNVTAAGCSFDVAGTVAGSFNDATQVFDPVSGPSGLKISTVPVGGTCPLAGMELGDDYEVNGTWTASPPLDISNP